MAAQDKLVLIDGNSLAYRAFFANMEIRASDGTPTGAVYGFLRMLYRLLDEERPRYVIVAFDTPGGTFRDDMYTEYKGTRQAAPDDFRPQLPLLREVLDALNIHYIGVPRFEADDIIGTLSRLASEQGLDTLIVTGDQDALQLVDDHVTVVLTRKGVTELQRLDPAAVKETFGLSPGQIIDKKGLMGDTSDNIPGVPGVGEKTATRLLQQYGTLEEVLAQVDQISGPKLQQNLREYAGDAELSKRLATIDRAAPVELRLAECELGEPKWADAQAMFRRLEFKSLLPKVTAAGAPEAVASGAPIRRGEVDVQSIPAEAMARSLAGRLPGALGVTVPMRPVPAGEPVPASGRLQPLGAALAPLGAETSGSVVRWVEPGALPGLDPYWPTAGGMTGFDLKPFLNWLYRRGVRPAQPAFDAKIAAYLLDPGRSSYHLADLARTHGLGELPDDDGPAAAAARASVMGALCERLTAELKAAGLEELFRTLEMPLVPILAQMEAAGIGVDKSQLEAMGTELEQRIGQIMTDIYREVGHEFNLNSPKQLAEVLFEKLGLPVIKRTKTGPSTDADVLEELAEQAPVVEKILDYRTLVKLKGTYVDGLGPLVESDGRIHTTLHQTVAATGRLSSSDPNLQNIPIRIEEGRRIRKVFIPTRPGHVLFAADYSQIELRVVAHYSGDFGLTEAFQKDQDIHTRTASEVFQVPMEQVSKDQRRAAKAVNFGLIYGQGEFGLARALGIGRGEAREFIQRYFERYPGVKAYMDGKVAEAKESGFVTTLLGRRRQLPDIHARTYAIRLNAERAAINTPIQGTAADLMKIAMVAVHRRLKDSGLMSQMILQVHDELVFEAPADEVARLNELVCREMEQAMELDVPLKVESKVGANWYDMRPAGEWLAEYEAAAGEVDGGA